MTNAKADAASKYEAAAAEVERATAACRAAVEALKPHLERGVITTKVHAEHGGLVRAQHEAFAARKKALAKAARLAKAAGIETPAVRYRRRMREYREARDQRAHAYLAGGAEA